jgi:hypothetical protein
MRRRRGANVKTGALQSARDTEHASPPIDVRCSGVHREWLRASNAALPCSLVAATS